VGKLKVLFFAEGATLAHVVRPLMLAKGLNPACFDVALCRPESLSKFTNGLTFPVLDLECQESDVFTRKLDRGSPLYDFSTLCRYVEADLALIDSEKPDVIVGDFRLSLSASARLRSIPYIAICDAYWSPERVLTPPLPVMGFTRYAPIELSQFLFRRIAPFAFRLHAQPLEKLRAKFGLPSLGNDLRRCYTDADLRLFANFQALFPDVRTHEGADFIGPIAWSPEFVGDLSFLTGEGPLTYITMGSSGNPEVIEKLVPILENLGSRIVITTAGKPLSFTPKLPTTRIFDYLPGSMICQQASLVICNGGSPTTNQALTCGVPVLGIAQNMDQFLNMEAIANYGAGILVRADRTAPATLRQAIESLVTDRKYTNCAKRLAHNQGFESSPSALSRHIQEQFSRRKFIS
jgi:UDP:flavonoid glycosyltransferase YjiC (YdhE family)